MPGWIRRIIYPVQFLNTVNQPERAFGKCMTYLQTEFDGASEDETKHYLQEQMKRLQNIQLEVSTRGSTGAEFLGGAMNQ